MSRSSRELVFPAYLLPSLWNPSRRRRPSAAAATTALSPPLSTGRDDSSSPSAAGGGRTNPLSIASTSTTATLSTSSLFSASGSSQASDSATLMASPLSSPSSSPPSPFGLTRVHADTLRCGTCAADVAFESQIVSKGFNGRHGRAYLVSANWGGGGGGGGLLANIRVGRGENRSLATGIHAVADIYCLQCGTRLGWKYLNAAEQSQQYKIGKFILETELVVGYRGWEDEEAEPAAPGGAGPGWTEGDERPAPAVEFDSEDEDECEDLFAGTWDAAEVAERRRKRRGRAVT